MAQGTNATEPRSALVTGASSGIGARIALDLAAAGYQVVAVARREDRLAETAAQALDAGCPIATLATDVTDPDQARRAVERCVDITGRLDVVVNNAGLGVIGPLESAALDDWRRMVEVNVLGVLNVTHPALAVMLERGSGHLVAISSAAGRRVSAGNGVYSATKHAVGAFYESLRLELGPRGIRTTVIEPEVVNGTEIVEHTTHRPSRVALALSTATHAMTPDDVAAAVLFALSQPAGVNVAEMLLTN